MLVESRSCKKKNREEEKWPMELEQSQVCQRVLVVELPGALTLAAEALLRKSILTSEEKELTVEKVGPEVMKVELTVPKALVGREKKALRELRAMGWKVKVRVKAKAMDRSLKPMVVKSTTPRRRLSHHSRR